MTHARAAQQADPRTRRLAGGPATRGHPILWLQRAAGNRAVQAALATAPANGPVQRQLMATGAPADITAMLTLLEPAAGLKLTHDRKSKFIAAAGAAVKPKSAELAARLQAIIGDPARTAWVELGQTQQGVWFGSFPTDTNRRVQQLRIDHFIALEQAVPGAGVATLAHEIVENYEAQAVPAADWGTAFDVTHEKAMAAETKILDELQAAHGQPRSGERLHTHIAVVKTPGSGKQVSERTLHIEAHEVDYIVFEVVQAGRKEKMKVTRAPATSLGTWHCKGFTSRSRSVPKGSEPTLQKIADLLSKDPTASVVLRATADKASTAAAGIWYHVLQEGVRERMTDNSILRSWRRFSTRPATAGTSNDVEISVRRPDLP